MKTQLCANDLTYFLIISYDDCSSYKNKTLNILFFRRNIYNEFVNLKLHQLFTIHTKVRKTYIEGHVIKMNKIYTHCQPFSEE